jgi:glycosyltransferase 2 family protein
MSRRLTFVLGLALSALFLYLAMRGARLSEMAAVLRRANYWYMIPCVLFTLVAYALRSLRWRYLLHSVRPIPHGTLFSATMIGFMANNVLPARLGELVRAHVVGRRAGISRTAALASIVVERIFDLFTLLALFGVVSFVSPYPGMVGKAALIIFAGGCMALIGLIVWNRHPERFVRILLRFIPSRGRDRVAGLAGGFGDGLGVFDRGTHLWIVAGLSLLHWAAIIVVTWLCILSLGIVVPQPQASLVALVAIALITMVPSAPGFVGTLQGAGTAALVVFGVQKEQGLAFSIVYHATQWIPVNIVGTYCLVREGLSLGQLSRIGTPQGDSSRPSEAP